MTMSQPRGPRAGQSKPPSPRTAGAGDSEKGARAWWEPLAASVAFLTVFPVPRTDVSAASFGRATALFPLVGATLGVLLGGLGLVLDRVLLPAPTAALLLVTGTAVTGALHLDGLMDTADGVLGAGTAERRLVIMRDSRVGAFGVIAGILVILSQFACLVELTGAARLLALPVTLAMSRWVMTFALGLFPPARADGLGATVQAAMGRGPLVVGTLAAAAIALATGPLGIAIFASAAVVGLVGGHLLTRLLGGLTGDTYGALAVLVEVLGLYVAIAGLPAGSGS